MHVRIICHIDIICLNCLQNLRRKYKLQNKHVGLACWQLFYHKDMVTRRTWIERVHTLACDQVKMTCYNDTCMCDMCEASYTDWHVVASSWWLHAEHIDNMTIVQSALSTDSDTWFEVEIIGPILDDRLKEKLLSSVFSFVSVCPSIRLLTSNRAYFLT